MSDDPRPDLERMLDRFMAIQTDLAVLRTNFEHAPKRVAFDELEARVHEIVDNLKIGVAGQQTTLRSEIHELFTAFRAEQRAQYFRWLRQGAIIIAVIVSLLTSGLNGALKAAQMTGLIPVF